MINLIKLYNKMKNNLVVQFDNLSIWLDNECNTNNMYMLNLSLNFNMLHVVCLVCREGCPAACQLHALALGHGVQQQVHGRV